MHLQSVFKNAHDDAWRTQNTWRVEQSTDLNAFCFFVSIIMGKTILWGINLIVLLVIVLIVMSSNQIYNQKIVSMRTKEIIQTMENKSFAIRCVPSSIVIDQEEETVVTSLDCDKWKEFVETWYDSWIHFVTGDYSIITWPSYFPDME